jgi:hypothetical protein
LTYQGNPRNALEAVLAASRVERPAADPQAILKNVPTKPAATQVAVDRAAISLLARLLTYRPVQGPPILQIAACADEPPAHVAATLARTCAVVAGRTLFVTVEPPQAGLFLPPSMAGPLPDAFLAGLYHYRIGTAASDTDLLYGPLRQQAIAALINPFRIVVIRAPGPASGATLALAPLCHCTVLVVRAGITPLADIKAAAAAIAGAGGRLAGTVLTGGCQNRQTIPRIHQ